MIREQLIKQGVGKSTHFRMRGEDVSRLEGFSDAVFGFAITLVIVSLTPPQTAQDLYTVVSLKNLITFAICFTLLTSIWYAHYLYFRRFGLNDLTTVVLNLTLLFVVLFYVYPLKFIFTISFIPAGQPEQLPNGSHVVAYTLGDMPGIYTIYGLGYTAVFLIFLLMYLHAYRQRDQLDLTPSERYDTKMFMVDKALMCGVGLVSVLLAQTLPLTLAPIPGLWYAVSIPAYKTILGAVSGRRRRMLYEQAAEVGV